MHIHEDLQSVTYVVAGALEHSDSLGNHGVLTAGGVQRRWLGWGSEHQERNPSATERTEFIQVWLQTPQPETTALEQHTQYAAEDRFERWLQIVQSECSPSDGLMVTQDARVHVVRVDSSNGRLEYEFEAGHGGYVYLIDGDAEANLERLQTGDAARVTGEGRLHIQAFSATELLIVDVPV
jgi:quercetin 2,3-dioxygenase